MENNKKPKVRLISSTTAMIINFALPTVQRAIERALKDGSLLERLAAIFFGVTKETVDALSDENAENGDQVKAILLEAANEEVLPLLVEESDKRIAEIKSRDSREIVTFLRNSGAKILLLTTDENPNNADQLEAYADQLKETLFQFLREAGFDEASAKQGASLAAKRLAQNEIQ